MFFLFLLTFLLIALFTLKMQIEVEDFIIDTEAEYVIDKNNKIYISFFVFEKIKIFKKQIRKINKFKLLNKSIHNREKILKKDYGKSANYMELKKIDLLIQIGIEDSAITAIAVGIISSILGVLVRKPKYEVVPVFKNKNLFKLKLNCIIRVHLIHYIYIQIVKIFRKRVDKNERTSNRKSYDDCYE